MKSLYVSGHWFRLCVVWVVGPDLFKRKHISPAARTKTFLVLKVLVLGDLFPG
jgi:hypothetical protein